ncbi:hypothetical protein RMSM_06124 [Rhodopirellula maiorica SM1]|uniref:Uncharacterized protein n=1 Tax=Rhodopirellula maiorica SM1 TaxID=1265738 RepID=M5RC45_9BACT|nr:hypothetical protein RMSM_06124 [Rhodopirellula maiorica SM1]
MVGDSTGITGIDHTTDSFILSGEFRSMQSTGIDFRTIGIGVCNYWATAAELLPLLTP